MSNSFAIIEIGSNNTKTHVYDAEKITYEHSATIEFKKNYAKNQKIDSKDLTKLYREIQTALTHTSDIHIFGCSIFRSISKNELAEINKRLSEKFNTEITVVTQEDEATLTAYGCYSDIDYDDTACIFIGGGGSTEMVIVKNQKVVDRKYLDFGVVDITNKFESLREDTPTCSFDEVYAYIDSLVGDIGHKCDLLVLAGGDHLYWYNNARYGLSKNHLYSHAKQEHLITIKDSDKYDRDALVTSLDKIRVNSDNPLWFDGSRAMKVLTNVISHKVNAKYIIPTKINMEDGLARKIIESEKSKQIQYRDARFTGAYDGIWQTVGKCVFCDMRDKYIFHEENGIVMTVPLYAYIDGQILIVPRRHVRSVKDLTPDEWETMRKFMYLAKKLIREIYGIKGMQVVQKDGVAAQSTVEHLHFHCIPFDAPDLCTWNYRKLQNTPIESADLYKSQSEKIKKLTKRFADKYQS